MVNGSSDRSWDVCQTLAERYPTVRSILSPRGGWGLAVQIGLREVRGDILCYTNSARTAASDEAWRDHRRTGEEVVYVGYSPIVVVDADKILTDLPDTHVVHVVRNPWSASADTKKRPVPLSLGDYVVGWTLNQYHALLYRERFRGRLHIVRAEDVMADPGGVLGTLCDELGLV